MKKLTFICAAFFLAACQQTPQQAALPETNEVIEPVVVETPPPVVAIEPRVLAPHEHEDVWQRIRSQLTIEVPDQPAVKKWKKYYLSHPRFMATISKRAEPYLHYIVEEIEKRNMPLELALLPIVESAYLPYGVSHKSAVGLWQFMPASAKRFDVRINKWFDGRRDVIESTNAALSYFEFFHDTFDEDWLNAVAAFNSGEGRVGRAIQRNKKAGKGTDFWSLKLPSETNDFVPKLLAIADILKHHESLDYEFTPIKNKAAVEFVSVDNQLDLELAAQWSGIDVNRLQQLNPGLNFLVTMPNQSHQLVVPADKAQTLRKKLSQTDPKNWMRWLEYRVKSGDSLSRIASKHDTKINEIKQANDLNSNRIYIGQTLTIPLVDFDKSMWLSSTKKGRKVVHTVKSGDNLWDIGRAYKVSVKDIVRWNRISAGSILKLKQKLTIIQ